MRERVGIMSQAGNRAARLSLFCDKIRAPLSGDAVDLHSWGLLRSSAKHVFRPKDRFDAENMIRADERGWAIFAAGRSYSDVALPRCGAGVVLTEELKHVISFDRDTGVMEVEAGVSLRDIQRLGLSAGWGLPILPGTSWATAGGALANDVHGKNHTKKGAFSVCVKRVGLWRSDRGLMNLDRSNKGLWSATVGGLGATGLIVSLALQLEPWKSGIVRATQQRFVGVREFLSLAKNKNDLGCEYMVGWVDAFANPMRGVLFTGDIAQSESCHCSPFAPAKESKLPLPMIKAINAPVSKWFNQAYWWAHSDKKEKLLSWEKFFCPLDNIANWNRLYGRNGFAQFQCVVQDADAVDVLNDIFRQCRMARQGSFLSVIKKFGSIKPEGILSFPREGVTFAMDFPNQTGTAALLKSLAAVVVSAKGALYPAKVCFESMEQFETSFPSWRLWEAHWDPLCGATGSRWIERLLG